MKKTTLALLVLVMTSLASAQPIITINNPEENSTVTTSFTWLSISTDEEAICEYSLCRFSVGSGWGGGGCSAPQDMFATGGTSHLQLIRDLENTINNKTLSESYRIDASCENTEGESEESVAFYVDIEESYIKLTRIIFSSKKYYFDFMVN